MFQACSQLVENCRPTENPPIKVTNKMKAYIKWKVFKSAISDDNSLYKTDTM